LIFLIYYGISTFSVAADGDEATRLVMSDELKKYQAAPAALDR
jgi:hypothetical protein